ncbi:hypothetical protein ACLK11_21640 [Escherichia coli]
MVNAHGAMRRLHSRTGQITPGDADGFPAPEYSGDLLVSGGPMEAGKTKLSDQIIKLDLVDAMIQGEYLKI